MKITKFVCYAVTALALISPTIGSAESEYPSKSVDMVVPFPAGGHGIDFVARTLSQRMSEITGQSVIVNNRPGAGTIIGTGTVAKSKPDGHTLLVMANSFTVNPSIHSDLPYDTRADFDPVTLLTITPHVLVARKALPADDLDTILKISRDEPGSLTYASIGNGTSPHLAGELLKKQADVDIVHVPFKGTPPAINALLGDHVDLLFGNLPDVLPYVKDGQLKAIAISANNRHESMENIPTMSEAGFPDFESNSWYGVVVPAGTPQTVINQLNGYLTKILAEDEIQKTLAKQGLAVQATSPTEFKEWIDKEIDKYAEIIEASGAKLD